MLYWRGWKIVALLLACATVACSRTDPEQALRQTLAQLQAAVEARDASAVADTLAEDFVGNDGMDRREARALALLLMKRHQSLGVSFGLLDVRMQPPSNAVATFTAMTTGGSGGLLPERMQAYAVETAWREVDGEWLLYHARWTPRM